MGEIVPKRKMAEQTYWVSNNNSMSILKERREEKEKNLRHTDLGELKNTLKNSGKLGQKLQCKTQSGHQITTGTLHRRLYATKFTKFLPGKDQPN